MIDKYIAELVAYALEKRLITEDDRVWAANRLLGALGLDGWSAPDVAQARPLEDILRPRPGRPR